MFTVFDKKISISRGDTGLLKITVTGVELTENDRAEFLIATPSCKGEAHILLRAVLKPSEDLTSFEMPFLNTDTIKWEPGSYVWQFRVFTNAVLDDDGMLIGGDETYTPYLPKPFEVLKVVGVDDDN